MLRGFGFVRVERQYYYIDWLLQVFAICTRVLVTLPLLRSLRKLCVAGAQLPSLCGHMHRRYAGRYDVTVDLAGYR
jgi:hypothetical protein